MVLTDLISWQGSDSTINASKWLNNILPAPKGEENRVEDGDGDGSNGPSPPPPVMATPQKPVNLLPEVPTNQSRKLTEREQRDCEVIGEYKAYPALSLLKWK